MLGELKNLFDIIDAVSKKKKANNKLKNRDTVLTAIYFLGNDGRNAVTSYQLENEGGFSKLQILEAIEAAKEKDWIIDAATMGGQQWLLKLDAQYYIKAIIRE